MGRFLNSTFGVQGRYLTDGLGHIAVRFADQGVTLLGLRLEYYRRKKRIRFREKAALNPEP